MLPTANRWSFNPGETNLTISDIKIIDDGIRQPNGLTVGLRLSQVTDATLGLASATLNIIDNDYDPGYVTFSSVSYVTNETSGAAILTVNRAGANKGSLSVQCITTNGSAISGVNYVGVHQYAGLEQPGFHAQVCRYPAHPRRFGGSRHDVRRLSH